MQKAKEEVSSLPQDITGTSCEFFTHFYIMYHTLDAVVFSVAMYFFKVLARAALQQKQDCVIRTVSIILHENCTLAV